MTPECQTMQDDLKAYMDSELSPIRYLAVRLHLARCASCREEIKIMEQLSEKLQASESEASTDTSTLKETLNPALREKILASVAEANDPAASSRSATSDNEQDKARDAATKTVTPWLTFQRYGLQFGALASLVLVITVMTLTFMGNRLRTGFSAAAGSISTVSDGSYTYTSPKSASGGGVGSRDVGGPLNIYDHTTGKYYSSRSPASSVTRENISGSAGAPQAKISSTDDVPAALRQVHKEASITVAVAKVEDQSDSVVQMVKGAGGFVLDNTLSTGANGLKTASLTIRVPVKQFEIVMGQISKLGEVRAKNITGEDITEKVSDAQQEDRITMNDLSIKEAQLKAALQKEEQLIKKQVTQETWPNVWQHRSEVRRLRIEAAQARARLNLLKRLSDMGNISVQLQEKAPTPSEGGFLQEMSDSGRAARDTFLLAVRVPMHLLIWLIALSPLWVPAIIAYRYLSRTYLQPKPEQQ